MSFKSASNDQHELYKDFLEYAKKKGLNLASIETDYLSDDPMRQESDRIGEFEEAMYQFLGVSSTDEDTRLFALLEAPGIYEINHPRNFK